MKTCKNPACENENPQPLDNFVKSSRHKDGILPYCRECENLRRLVKRRERAKEPCSFEDCKNGMSFKKTGLCWGHQRQLSLGYELAPIVPASRNMRKIKEGTKWCRVCERWLEFSLFSPAKGLAGGLAGMCRRCDTGRRYGITAIQYEIMLEAQDGKCLICELNGDRVLYVDHDHSCCPGDTSCGKCIRGLLCQGCNHGLGNFQDNTTYLANAIKYLERHMNDRL